LALLRSLFSIDRQNESFFANWTYPVARKYLHKDVPFIGADFAFVGSRFRNMILGVARKLFLIESRKRQGNPLKTAVLGRQYEFNKNLFKRTIDAQRGRSGLNKIAKSGYAR
jgi:hypothetical protein